MGFEKTIIQQRAVSLFISGASRFLLYGGSRSGKSFIIIYCMIVIAVRFPKSRHLVARLRFNSVKRSIWLDTLPKVLEVCFPDLKVHWNNEDYYISLPNGSQIWIGGLDDKERTEKILGMEFLTIFENEASQITYEAHTTLLTRLAQLVYDAEGKRGKNLLFVDENPPGKKHWTYKVFVEHIEPETRVKLPNPELYASLKMNPADNVENISEEYMNLLDSLPERKKKRFLRGEFGDSAEGALWSDEGINATRFLAIPVLKRIVISIDPAVSSKDTSDETGIIVEGITVDNRLCVLEDLSGTYTPTEWATIACDAFKRWKADRVIGEVNNGGDLIETVIRTIAPNIPYRGVHATRDKYTRAEPVAALWEQEKGGIYGQLPELEDEMTTWEGKKGEPSPNRIDALVWGAADLIPDLSTKRIDIHALASAFQ